MIELAQRTDFSYAGVWKLKEEYLKRLYDSIRSPHKRTQVRNTVSEEERKEIEQYEKQFPALKKIISNDPKMYNIKRTLFRWAQFEPKGKDVKTDIFLWGESGTGKELFAEAIHQISGRKGQFVPVNCANIPDRLFESAFFGHKKGAFTDAHEDKKGYFAEANGGTVFLDEIGDLPPEFQPKFLRAIQEQEIQPLGGQKENVDVKIVYATNKDIDEMVSNGEFRLDLYQRITILPLSIPPLRKSKNDIPLLVYHFIDRWRANFESNSDLAPFHVADDCMDLLKKYEWPGNVRELENLITFVMANRPAENDRREITPSDLPPKVKGTKKEIREESKTEKNLPGNMKVTDEQLIACMAKHNNNKTHVAKELGVHPKTIRRRWGKLNP